eukprot:365665-Chlamydomonas_euryale.AAC.14
MSDHHPSVHALKDMDLFADKLRKLSIDGEKRFNEYGYDVEVRKLPQCYHHSCLCDYVCMLFDPSGICQHEWACTVLRAQIQLILGTRGMLHRICCRSNNFFLCQSCKADIAAYRKIAETVKPLITDTVEYINSAHEAGRRILIEGANATMLDIDFGTYPFVTSSNPSIGGIATGLGLAPSKFDAVIGVVRTARSPVHAGPALVPFSQ